MGKIKSTTKTRTFVIEKGFIGTFFGELEESELDYELTEIDGDGDLCVQVDYSSTERDKVMSLVELEDEFYGEETDEDDEENQYNDEEEEAEDEDQN